jgi:hypothetical protein
LAVPACQTGIAVVLLLHTLSTPASGEGRVNTAPHTLCRLQLRHACHCNLSLHSHHTEYLLQAAKWPCVAPSIL